MHSPMSIEPTQSFTHLLARLRAEQGVTTGQWGGLRMSSHFQPIYSLSHMRLVGHEALLRAHNSQGHPIPPPEVFASCQDPASLAECDRLSRFVHLSNYTAQPRQGEWLFLNVHPDVFNRLGRMDGSAYLHQVASHFGLPCEGMVLEVLEDANPSWDGFGEAAKMVKNTGALLAIDDFGAGHSNFDRVWRLQPDIVKLDRSLITRAAQDNRIQRVVAQMVSLLHECGAMVLMEGIETEEEAMVALDCDADMVQGYYFGRPQATLMANRHTPPQLASLYGGLALQRQTQRHERRERIGPFLNAIGNAGVLLSAGRAMTEACQGFLDLADAELCYVLDAQGYQIGHNMWASGLERPLNQHSPLSDSQGACWSRRPYFRRAIESINKVQITRPYRTMHGQHQCVTVSMAFLCQVGDRTEVQVVCGDVLWT
jgi:EAL domain-containing protein (putative c-di-GMP-specific phosphodiesterase class I)